jgi:heme exporter protein C
MSHPLVSNAPAAPSARPRGAPTPDRPAGSGRAVNWLSVAAALAVVGSVVRALAFTPVEALQGPAQKIFYVHVPSAVVALYLALGVLAVTSALYLWLKDERLDRMAESAAEVGFVFMSVVIVTGPIWARPIWGVWWTWDARLTLTLFLWFVMFGYLVMRGAVDDPSLRARYAAVLGLLAPLLVPFIHLSVVMFRTLHPQAIVLKPSAPSMPGEMVTTWLVAQAAFVLLFVALLRARYRYGVERDRLAALESR